MMMTIGEGDYPNTDLSSVKEVWCQYESRMCGSLEFIISNIDQSATYLDEDSAKDVSSPEIFTRKREPAICKKGKGTADSWGEILLVIFKVGSVLGGITFGS